MSILLRVGYLSYPLKYILVHSRQKSMRKDVISHANLKNCNPASKTIWPSSAKLALSSGQHETEATPFSCCQTKMCFHVAWPLGEMWIHNTGIVFSLHRMRLLLYFKHHVFFGFTCLKTILYLHSQGKGRSGWGKQISNRLFVIYKDQLYWNRLMS